MSNGFSCYLHMGKAAQPFHAAVYCTALCMRWFCKQIHKHKREEGGKTQKKADSCIVQYTTVRNNLENFKTLVCKCLELQL